MSTLVERCAQVPRPGGVVRRSRASGRKYRGRPRQPRDQATKNRPRRLDPGLSWRGLSVHTIGGTLYWVDERLGDALYFWHPITSRISSRMPDSDGEYCGDADNNGE